MRNKLGQSIRNPKAYFKAVREDRYGYNSGKTYSSRYNHSRKRSW